MARYNRWMNDKLYALAATLTDEERKRPMGAFSGRSTALSTTCSWPIGRGWPGSAQASRPRCGACPTSSTPDFDELRGERAKTDRALEAYVASLTDRALEGTLAYRTMAGADGNGPRDRRMRIEHAFVVRGEDIPRFAALSVIASMQPVFCCLETGTNYDPHEKNPSDRWKSLSDSGALLAFGSDWPCAWPPDPFVNIQEAVTRAV